MGPTEPRKTLSRPLYTPEERRRRDATPWTIVQGVLAPVQFLVFLISLGLVLNFLWIGAGETAATVSMELAVARDIWQPRGMTTAIRMVRLFPPGPGSGLEPRRRRAARSASAAA